MIKKYFIKLAVVFMILLFYTSISQAVRIKDIASIKGVRKNQLVGYGLVVGLNGTGDSKDSEFMIQSLASMLEKMGVTVKIDGLEVDNVAAVMVTADLPPFANIGNKIDVLVNSIGDAENLQGGTLLFTPLKGADDQVYAVAQGSVSTGGFSAGGAGAGVQKNFPTVGRVVGGAMIEKELSVDFSQKKEISLILHSPDFTTAFRVAEAINAAFSDNPAQPRDSAAIDVEVPARFIGNIVHLVYMIEGIEVIPDVAAKVVINERTGTVVMGSDVRISTVAIAHGNLSIIIKESPQVSQPMSFARRGETVVTPDTQIDVKEGDARLILMDSGVSIKDVVRALNALGVSPRDLISIFQAIKAAGAMQAELEII